MDITTVRILVGKQLGFSEAQSRTPSLLSQADAIKLGDYTFAYIAQHPDQFTPDQVARAQHMVDTWGVNTPLLDTSFDWGMLADEVANNVASAVEDVAQVGKGVLSTFRMAGWLIPTTALVVAGLIVWKYYKGQPIGLAK